MTLSTVVPNAHLVAPGCRIWRNLSGMLWAGMVDTLIGVYFLTRLSPTIVGLVLGATVIIYVVSSPWKAEPLIAERTTMWAVVPVGLVGGTLLRGDLPVRCRPGLTHPGRQLGISGAFTSEVVVGRRDGCARHRDPNHSQGVTRNVP